MNGSSKVLSSVLLSGVLLVAGLTNPVEFNSKQTKAADNHSNITMVSASKLVKYKLSINGKDVSYYKSSIRISPNYLLPANRIIRLLGGTTTFNSKTKVLTIKRGRITSTIKQGSKVATVNGKKITLSTNAQVINDVFMIPQDLMAKATGTKISISTNAKTIEITQASPITPSRIKTKYQGHTYGADNQYQYDKTMAYVNNYFKNYKSTFVFGYDYGEEAYEDYFKKGVKVPPEWDRHDYYYRGLDLAERWGKDLKKNKVPYSQIEKLAEVESKARDFLNDQPMLSWDDAYDVYSAYHFFYKRKGDSDSYALAQQIVFDMNGYKTRILSTPPLSWLEVQINGKWYIQYDEYWGATWKLSSSSGIQ